MAKKKEHSEWLITKGRLSRHQREQKRRRLIISIGSAIITIVLVIVAIGIYQDVDSDREPYRQTVLKVNDVSFDMDYYIEMLRVEGVVFFQDNPLQSAKTVLQNMQTREYAMQLASTLEIAASEEEIDLRIQEQFTPPDLPDNEGPEEEDTVTPVSEEQDFFQEWLDTTGASEKYFRVYISEQIIQQKIAEQVNEDVESQVNIPNEMDQAHLWGILFDTVIETGTPAITADPIITGTSTATIDPIITGTSTATIEPTATGTSTAASVTETLDPKQIRDTIEERLEAGEDFATLFEEFSQPITGSEDGDLNWAPNELTILYYGEDVAQVASKIETGVLSEPIPRTPFEGETSYWVIMVTEREESRPLEEGVKSILENQALNKALMEWEEEQTANFVIDNYLDDPEDDDDIVVSDDDIRWAIGKAVK